MLQAENQIRVAEKLEGESIVNLGYEKDIDKIIKNLSNLIYHFHDYVDHNEKFKPDQFKL